MIAPIRILWYIETAATPISRFAVEVNREMLQSKLTLSEMAKRLGISTKTFSRQVHEMRIPYYPAGKRMRFDPFEVEAYIRTAKDPADSTVRLFPVVKRQKRKVVSQRFAEAV